MTEALSPNSSIVNAAIDQDSRPQTKDELMSKIRETSFDELIEKFHQINQDMINQLKKLAESRQNDQTPYSVPDIKTSAAFKEILQKNNLSEQEGLNLLKKAEEKLQELKAIKA